MPEVFLWHWLAFGAVVALLLSLDLLVFHRHDHASSLPEAAGWSAFWIGLGLGFNGLVWWWGVVEGQGSEPGVQFLSAYLLEKSLSVDNIFVFAVIFHFFGLPAMYQYRVLFWGILGAIVLRLVFILAGIELIHRFSWVAPLFGAFLVYTAYALARHAATEVHPEKNLVVKIARRFLRLARGDHRQHGHHFFVRESGRWCMTPMFLALLVIESSDVVFAVDSVPAVIAITDDRFIAFASNVFAILGLRALYFLLVGVIDIFCYLHYGLAAVLGFVGLKMIAEWWIPHEEGTQLASAWVCLVVIAVLLGISILASMIAKRRDRPDNRG